MDCLASDVTQVVVCGGYFQNQGAMTLGDRKYKWMVTYSVVDSEECGEKFMCE